MNATLQSLSNIQPLTNFFLKKFKPGDPKKIMSNEYHKVVLNLWDKKYNGKYSDDEVNSKQEGLWASSICHPYAPGSQWELGLKRRRMSEWKLFTTGEIDYFDNFMGSPFYCFD